MALPMDSPMEGADQSDDVFARTLNHFKNSKQVDHQHLCAVILALSEVIKEQGLTPSATAYFAAIMASLERRQVSLGGCKSCNSRQCCIIFIVSLLGGSRDLVPVLMFEWDSAGLLM